MGADGKHDGCGRSARADEYLVASDDAGHESKAATKRSATEAGHIELLVERVRANLLKPSWRSPAAGCSCATGAHAAPTSD